MLGYRPLVYFWIAEYTDGSALPQFDPDTGKEIQGHPDWLPSKIDENGMVVEDNKKIPYREAYPIPEHFRDKQIVRIGWYPFNSEYARKIFDVTGKIVIPSEVNPIVINLKDGEEPVCHRSHSINLKMASARVEYAPIIYVLGVRGKRIRRIDEDGKIIGNAD